jgi:hypothetical protein
LSDTRTFFDLLLSGDFAAGAGAAAFAGAAGVVGTGVAGRGAMGGVSANTTEEVASRTTRAEAVILFMVFLLLVYNEDFQIGVDRVGSQKALCIPEVKQGRSCSILLNRQEW